MTPSSLDRQVLKKQQTRSSRVRSSASSHEDQRAEIEATISAVATTALA